MAPVQTSNAAAVTASLSVTFSAATAGNLLVIMCASDATVSTPAGWSVAISDVGSMGAYLFYKVAAGGETSASLVPSVSDNIAAAFAEYSGTTATPLDQTATARTLSSSGTTQSTGTTGTTAQANELVVVGIGAHSGLPSTAPSWVTATQRDGAFAGTGSPGSGAFLGDFTVSATGTYTDTATLTAGASDRTGFIATFKLAGGASTATFVSTQAQARRRPPIYRRRRICNPAPAGAAPASQVNDRPAPKGMIRRRSKSFAPVPAQVVVAPPAMAPRASLRQALKGIPRRRPAAATPIQPQAAPLAPAFPPRAVGRLRLKVIFRRPRGGTSPSVDQSAPIVRQIARRTPPRMRRRLLAGPVPQQVSIVPPAYPVAASVPRRLLKTVLKRRRFQFPWVGQDSPTIPKAARLSPGRRPGADAQPGTTSSPTIRPGGED
jgi:hypothetical protein